MKELAVSATMNIKYWLTLFLFRKFELPKIFTILIIVVGWINENKLTTNFAQFAVLQNVGQLMFSHMVQSDSH